jgi:hypothetical protein
MMAFSPEDKRAWLDSEVMAEFERVAAGTDLLGGGPPEAFQPIPEATAGRAEPGWEDDDVPEPEADTGLGQRAELAGHGARLMDGIGRMAQDLAEAGRTSAAYRLERALAALKDIAEKGGE